MRIAKVAQTVSKRKTIHVRGVLSNGLFIFSSHIVNATLIGVYQSTARLLRNILIFLFVKFDKKIASKTIFEKWVVSSKVRQDGTLPRWRIRHAHHNHL